MGLRAEIEAELAETLEDDDDFGLPVILTAPDGVVYAAVYGRIQYDSIVQDEGGNAVIDSNPIVTLRRSSLTRIPAPSEKWAVTIPVDPTTGAPTSKFLLERAAQGGRSIGFINLFLRRAEQS